MSRNYFQLNISELPKTAGLKFRYVQLKIVPAYDQKTAHFTRNENSKPEITASPHLFLTQTGFVAFFLDSAS